MKTRQRLESGVRREIERISTYDNTQAVPQPQPQVPTVSVGGGAGKPVIFNLRFQEKTGGKAVDFVRTVIIPTGKLVTGTNTAELLFDTLPNGTIHQTLRHTGVGTNTWEATSRVLVKSNTPIATVGDYGVEITSPNTEVGKALGIFNDSGYGLECRSKFGSEFFNSDGSSNIVLKSTQYDNIANSICFLAQNYSDHSQAYAIQGKAYKNTLSCETMFLGSLSENTITGSFINSSQLTSGYRGVSLYASATGIRKRAAQFDLTTADASNTVVEVNTPNATKGIVVNAPGSPRQVANNNAGISVYCTDSSHLAILTDGYIHSFGIINTNTSFTVLDTNVVSQRRTGWAAPTGTATRTTFNTATVTLAQLAERVKALIDDLTTHGLIGA